MTDRQHDPAALAALARAFRRGWPARMVDKAAPGWAELLLAALRAEPDAPASVAAALLDEAALTRAIAAAGISEPEAVARAIIAELAGDA